MILAETGRFPLAIDINLQYLLYWVKILSTEESSYIKLVYSEMFLTPIKHEWIRYVKYLLCSSGFSGIWEQQFVQDERLQSHIMQNGFNEIRESSRYRMSKEIKQVHKPERYSTININKNLR